MMHLRDALDALRGRIEHGEECECHSCGAEQARYEAEAEAQTEARNRMTARRKVARAIMAHLAEQHGHALIAAMSETYTYGATRTVVDAGLDALTVPVWDGHLVLTHVRDGSITSNCACTGDDDA